MNEVFNAIRERRSVRKYKEKEPERKKIEKVIEAANWAPSNGNSQPWNFYVARAEVRDEICRVFYVSIHQFHPGKTLNQKQNGYSFILIP